MNNFCEAVICFLNFFFRELHMLMGMRLGIILSYVKNEHHFYILKFGLEFLEHSS